jgi:hypothetical protein
VKDYIPNFENDEYRGGPLFELELYGRNSEIPLTAEQAFSIFLPLMAEMYQEPMQEISDMSEVNDNIPLYAICDGAHYKPGEAFWKLRLFWREYELEPGEGEWFTKLLWQFAQEQGLNPAFSVFGLELCYYPEEDDLALVNGATSAAELARRCCALYWLSENT